MSLCFEARPSSGANQIPNIASVNRNGQRALVGQGVSTLQLELVRSDLESPAEGQRHGPRHHRESRRTDVGHGVGSDTEGCPSSSFGPHTVASDRGRCNTLQQSSLLCGPSSLQLPSHRRSSHCSGNLQICRLASGTQLLLLLALLLMPPTNPWLAQRHSDHPRLRSSPRLSERRKSFVSCDSELLSHPAAPVSAWARQCSGRLGGLVLAGAVSTSDAQGASGNNGGGGGDGGAAATGTILGVTGEKVDKGSLLMRPSFDASLDWASNVTAKGKDGCTLAKKAARPPFFPPRCPPPRRPVSIEDARRVGWRFAPLLHQHSLDWSRLSDPGAWLESAVLVDPVTYTTTDLTTYLENRHLARRAKTEKAAAEAAAAAAAAGDPAQAKTAAAATERAAAAAAEAAAADPYWLIHEAYDTHNFFATRLVKRRYGSAPPKASNHGREAAQQQSVLPGATVTGTKPSGGAAAHQQHQLEDDQQDAEARSSHTAAGRRMRDEGEGPSRWRRVQQQRGPGESAEDGPVEEIGEDGAVIAGGGTGGGGGGGGSSHGQGSREEDLDPYWPHFESLQGAEFFDAIAGDPFIGEDADEEAEAAGENRDTADSARVPKAGRRREAAESAGSGAANADSGSDGDAAGGNRKTKRLGGKVYFTVFEPRLEHLHWKRPARPGAAPDQAASADAGFAEAPEPTFAFVYTFWFFYPFNGCSNQLMATRFAGRHQAAEYFLCPLGVHEGDWEHLKVYVCQDGMLDEHDPARSVVALQYSQHTWLPTYDCTKGGWPGECSFEKDPDNGQLRPRVYSGLHSHANSPHTSNLNVYAKVNFKQLLNFDGIYVADRFAEGGPLFVPSPNNTPWLPFPHEMGEAQGVRPEDIRPGGRLAWTAYLGNWGVPLTSPNFSITCLTRNLSAASECDPRNPPVFILDRLLGGITARPENMTWTPVLSPKRVALELSEPISNPLVRRGASYSWERELAAPLWDDREPLPGLGGLSLAALARDTSSLDCPLAEDVHRTFSWGSHYLGNDPRVAHRLRLFVAAATAAVVAAAALSALVVKCMPLILAPHHQHHHSHHHHQHHAPQYHGHYYLDGNSAGSGELNEMSYHGSGGSGGGNTSRGRRQVGMSAFGGASNTFGLVYGKVESQYEPLPQHDDLSHGVATAPTTSAPYRVRRRNAAARLTAAQEWEEPGDGGDGALQESASASESSYSSFNSPTASDTEPPPARGADGQLLSFDGLSGGSKGRQMAASSSGLPPAPFASPMRFSEGGNVGVGAGVGGGGGGGASSVVPAHRRGSEEQPLLAQTLSRTRRDGGGGGGVGNGSEEGSIGGAAVPEMDDDDGGKHRRGCGSFIFRTAAACPAPELLPLLAWRGCLAACRCVCLLACYPCRLCFPGDGGSTDPSGTSSTSPGPSSARRRKRRGLGPYLLGCATQPERRLLWLSLGIMAYSLGLIMSAQGLLETLHALRNLLLRGLWAIAGLEGVFVALLAAGGVVELTLMVVAASLAPKPPEPHHAHHRRGSARAEAGGAAAAAASAPEASGDEVAPGLSSLPLSTSPSAPVGNNTPSGALVQLQPMAARAGSSSHGATTNGVASAAPVLPSLGSRSASGGGAASDWESYGIHQHHIQFPSTAAVAATAAAATAAATAAASAAATAAATAAAKVPWRTLALLAAVGYMEVAASLHLLGFALALWVGVLGASEGCSAAVQGLYRVISFSPDVCLDLSVIGVPGPRCGGDLMQMCNVWRQLRLSGLLYGSLLIIAARLLLLIMATANYHSRHAVLLPLPHHHHHHHHAAPHRQGSPQYRQHDRSTARVMGAAGGQDRAATPSGEAAAAAGSSRVREYAWQKGTGAAPVEAPGGGASAAAAGRGSGQEPRRRSSRQRKSGAAAESEEAGGGRPPRAAAPSAVPSGLSDPAAGGSGGAINRTVRPRHARDGSGTSLPTGVAAAPELGATANGGSGGGACDGDVEGGGGGDVSVALPVSTAAGAGGGHMVLEMGAVGPQMAGPGAATGAAGAAGPGGGGVTLGARRTGSWLFGWSS